MRKYHYLYYHLKQEKFAQQIAEDCGDVPRNMPSWIEIDWEKSWDNLDYDYVESTDGHIFSQNF